MNLIPLLRVRQITYCIRQPQSAENKIRAQNSESLVGFSTAILFLWAGKKAQWVKCLLYKHEDLSSGPQHIVKS